MSLLRKFQQRFKREPDDENVDISTQAPLPVSGGTLCKTDIWKAESDIGNFTGANNSVDDLFDNLHTVLTDTTGTNPKEILIHFNNSTIIYAIGLGAFTGDFSNVEIQFLTSGGVAFTAYDGSAISAKETTFTNIFNVIAGANAIKLRFHTTDTVSLSNVFIVGVAASIARIQGVSEASGEVEDVTTFDGALNVTDGLVHKLFVNRFFEQDTGVSTTLSAAASALDTDIIVTSAVGFSIGDVVELRTNGAGSILEINFVIDNIAGTTITLNRPLDNDYSIGATFIAILQNMAVDGSVTPQSFKLIPPPAGDRSVFQITRFLIGMTHVGTPDDGKFGGIAALSSPVLIRAFFDGGYSTATQWYTNGDMVTDMFNVEYRPSAPAGLDSTSGRWTITNSGAIFEIDGKLLEFLEIIIQDDLTGLETFYIKAQGRIFGV